MNFPGPPQGLNAPAGKDAGFDQWLFIFWSWLKSAIGGLFPGTAGTVVYVDSTGNALTSEAAFTYNATTNTLAVVNTDITGVVSFAEISDPGYADANEAWVHAEDVSGITQLHYNTSINKWTLAQDLWLVARNTSGSTIGKLKVVRVTGSTGQRPEIALADADLHHSFLGVTQDSMANNAYGSVVTMGYVKGVDTSAWAAGTLLYLSQTAGDLTSTEPTYPANSVEVGVVIFQHASNGIFQVIQHENVSAETIQDAVGTILTDSTTIDFTYNDATPSITAAAITQMSITADASGLKLSGDATSPGNNKVYGTNGSGTKGWQDAPSSDGVTKTITQNTHGFSVGNWVYFNGTIYALADADASATAEAVGVVKTVTDSNTFIIQISGYVSGLSGLTAGTTYFLSGTAGALTATEPSTSGQVSKPLLIADTTTSGWIFNWRGLVVGSGVAGVREVTSGTATAGQTVITATYTPGYVDVFINGVRLLAADFTATNGTSITLGTGMALNDEYAVIIWTVVALGTLYPGPPGGRLTLTSATPVMTAEAAAQTTIYYAPYINDLVPIYDGSSWTTKRFSELSIAMAGNAAWASGSVYDLYVYNDGGTLRLVTGAAWTNTTTRSESLTRINGIWTNTASMTGRYGTASTVTVAANCGLYVGTFYASANGTTTLEIGGTAAGGDQIALGIWNCYNRVQMGFCCKDSTDSWTYASATWTTLNSSTTNRISMVRGLNEDSVDAMLVGFAAPPSGNDAQVGIILDATSGTPNEIGYLGSSVFVLPTFARYTSAPGLGWHWLQAMQAVRTANSVTFYGDAGIPDYLLEGFSIHVMF